MIGRVAMTTNGAAKPNLTRARALMHEVCDMTAEMERLRAAHAAIARKRRTRMLRSNRLGMSYQEMAATCRISEAVITREIRQARGETRDADLAARLPTRRPGL